MPIQGTKKLEKIQKNTIQIMNKIKEIIDKAVDSLMSHFIAFLLGALTGIVIFSKIINK